MRKIMLALVATAALSGLVSGCSVLGVYRIDIPQGAPLTQAQVAQVHVGMTQQQVRYVLGSPSLTDTLQPNRWDYAYHYQPGTYARKAGLKPVQQQRLSLYFDNNVLARIDGAASIPATQFGLPNSRDTTLNAAPL
jgi:outer membrane protein assembly factor BamE